MRVCFLLEELAPSGGVGVALGHARGLAERGAEVEVLVTRDGSEASEAGVRVRPLAAADGTYDAAIATWWGTADSLWRVQANRRVVFLQSVEQRFYRDWELFDRLGAAGVLGLPVDFIVVAPWLKDLLAELRPDARCRVVRNGIDKRTFTEAPLPPSGGPLRVLVEGAHTLWFKGIPDALSAVRGMREPATTTLVTLDPAGADRLEVDRVVAGLDAAGMAELYAEHDVLLKLSRVESLGMAPVEGFHVGRPCLVTPYTGHEEYVRHGRNGLVVGFDDLPAASGWLDRLARDRELLARLGREALATAASWPGADEAQRLFASEVEALVRDPPPPPERAARQLAADVRLAVELGRRRAVLAGWDEAQLAEVRSEAIELRRQRDFLQQELDRIRGSRSYRILASIRRLLRRLVP
jgi:O-antigen biosynthesis protein